MKIYHRPDEYSGMMVCCYCDHNKRNGKGDNRCEIDKHYIGYVACFEQWCRRWTPNKKFLNEVTE